MEEIISEELLKTRSNETKFPSNFQRRRRLEPSEMKQYQDPEELKNTKVKIVKESKNRVTNKRPKDKTNNAKPKKKKDEDFHPNKVVMVPENSGVRRYPKRQVGIKNYVEIDEPHEDRYIFCDFCQESFLDCCPKCGQMAILQDNPVDIGVENRAKLTLPNTSLVIMPSEIHGLGVFAKIPLKKGMKMGPYEGRITRIESTSGYSWKLKNGQLVDAGDDKLSNWMRYVNCARHHNEQNIMAFQYQGKLFYRSCKDIETGQELLVYYGNNFATNLGIDVKGYFEPNIEKILQYGEFCPFCCVGYRDSSRLKNHVVLCKSNPVNIRKPLENIFNCRNCSIGITDEEFFKRHEMKCGKKRKRNKENIGRIDRNAEVPRGINRRYRCGKCEYVTQDSRNLIRHKRIHDKVALFGCKVCKKGFNLDVHLQNHMYKHLDIAEEKRVIGSTKIEGKDCTKTTIVAKIKGMDTTIVTYQCGRCTYITTQFGNINQHINSLHLRKTRFKCDFCSYFTTWKQGLKRHLNIIHYRDKILEDLTVSSDIKKNQLQQNRSHVEIRTWKCVHCDYKSFHKSLIKRHIKSIHKKIKDHVCGICGYATSQRGHLKKHIYGVHLKNMKLII